MIFLNIVKDFYEPLASQGEYLNYSAWFMKNILFE
jgi:hypothetical protein